MIEVQNLTKKYGSKVAVDDVTFTVRPGMVTGFLGPNGAGKSTTMRAVMGLDRPTSGRALVNGRPYAELTAPVSTIGALLDPTALDRRRSARSHLRALAATVGIGDRRVDEVLETVGLASVSRKAPRGFSLGMAQRLGIASALLADPEIVMLDEPVNGLDPDGVLWIRTLLRDLAAQGRTVFLSSHLMSEMELVADHLVVIGQGRIIADAPLAQLLSSAQQTHVEVTSPDADRLGGLLVAAGAEFSSQVGAVLQVRGITAAAIGDLAARHGLRVHELHTAAASLEEAYMDLTRTAVTYRAGSTPTSTTNESAL